MSDYFENNWKTILNLQIENVNLKCDYFLANINKLLEKLEKRSIQELINE